MKKIEIFDPAMCCSTGVCGPSVNPELIRVAAVVENLKKSGIHIIRHNLSSEPQAFVQNTIINAALNVKGTEILPVTMVDGAIVKEEWLEENVRTDANEYGYCLSALMSLKREDVAQHEKYIRSKLQKLYSEFYETAKANDATTMRKAICRVDELLYFDE